MATQSAVTIAQVQATATEGRMRDLRHRQKQLISLHRQLTENEAEAISALQADDGFSREEAEFVLAATLDEIRAHYDALDLKNELEVEYGIKRGKSNEQKRTVQPLAYIVPETFTLLYSVLAAFAAATEAGACCVFKLDNNLLSTPPLLGRIFAQVYDKEAVSITTSEPDTSLIESWLVVDQTGNADVGPGAEKYLPSRPESLSLGVVDRTANVKAAARELVQSRLAFRGSSRQAVDWVLVNEFAVEEFLDAVIENIKAWPQASGTKKETDTRNADLEALAAVGSQEVFDRPGVGSVTKTVLGRKYNGFLGRKIASRILSVDVVTSLDDAIDRLSNSGIELGALYIFAGLKEAKYLSQYIPARVSFVNHIPRRFHIGPVPALRYPASDRIRYTRQMFEFSSPQFVVSTRAAVKEDTGKLLREARRPLKPTGQPKAGAIGFFEVGVYLGATFYLLPFAAFSLAGIGFGLHKGWELYHGL
ncbi:hypothetical protein FALCPG4_002077 [Fusarium falciforme]